MRINAIQWCNPIIKTTPLNKNNISLSFQGVDTFEKQPYNFDEDLHSFYKGLEKKMGVKTSKDVEFLAENISVKTGANTDDVYKTLGILTQFSSYKSLSLLEKALVSPEIRTISNLVPIYENADGKNLPICLTNALHYIGLKNFKISTDNMNNNHKALVIDSKFLKILKDMPDDEREKFSLYYINNPRTHLYYIENFENGYNFLTQSGNLEDLAVDVINRAKNLKNHKSIEDNVRYILNKDNMRDMKKLGLKPQIIKGEIASTPRDIADNPNPIMPAEEDFKDVINNIGKWRGENKKQPILNFLKETLTTVTPEQFNKKLMEIHNNINTFLNENNKSWDDVYFIIPSKDKSFMLTNYIYQNINKDAKFMFINKNCRRDTVEKIENLPENSTIVVADDYLISGSSLLQEEFPYTSLCDSKILKDKNISIIFAPIAAFDEGIKKVVSYTESSGRKNLDKIIPGLILSRPDKETAKVMESIDILYDKYMTASVMPYMGPDNNCGTFVRIFQKFLYNPNAQKETMLDATIMPFLFPC